MGRKMQTRMNVVAAPRRQARQAPQHTPTLIETNPYLLLGMRGEDRPHLGFYKDPNIGLFAVDPKQIDKHESQRSYFKVGGHEGIVWSDFPNELLHGTLTDELRTTIESHIIHDIKPGYEQVVVHRFRFEPYRGSNTSCLVFSHKSNPLYKMMVDGEDHQGPLRVESDTHPNVEFLVHGSETILHMPEAIDSVLEQGGTLTTKYLENWVVPVRPLWNVQYQGIPRLH